MNSFQTKGAYVCHMTYISTILIKHKCECLGHAFTCLQYMYTTGAWAAPRSAWTTGACASLDISNPQGPELRLNVSRQQEPVLAWTWTCLHPRRLSAPERVYITGAFAASEHVYITGAFAAPECV
jgi:hypothetical protein